MTTLYQTTVQARTVEAVEIRADRNFGEPQPLNLLSEGGFLRLQGIKGTVCRRPGWLGQVVTASGRQ